MAHFAKIGLNGKVIEVLSVANEVLHDANGIEQEAIGIDFLTKLTGYPVWVQTSFNKNFRKNCAGIGYTYDEDRDAFIPKKLYQSWILNEDTCLWESPIPKPNRDGLEVNQYWDWNETNQSWDLTTI
jgi:hypothetical protein